MKYLVILLLIISCGKNSNKEIENYSLNFWKIKYFVNQNNEPTDVGYITNTDPIYGKFSNEKYQNKPLKVKIMIKDRAIGIKLYENKNYTLVKGNRQDPIEYDIKIKRNDKNIDFLFRGINETDLVVVGNIISSTHQDTLINYLKMGGEFDFYIETNNQTNKSIYEFSINDGSKMGFLDSFTRLTSK